MSVNYYLQVLLSLGIIGVLLYGFYRMMAVYKQRLYAGDLKIVDRVTIDSGVSVVILDYKGHQLLLGVSQKDIKIVKELTGS